MYKVTFRRVHVTTVAVEKQYYQFMCGWVGACVRACAQKRRRVHDCACM